MLLENKGDNFFLNDAKFISNVTLAIKPFVNGLRSEAFTNITAMIRHYPWLLRACFSFSQASN